MSKAFTREADDAPEAPLRLRGVAVPEGVPNYLTAAGADKLRDELEHCRDEARVHELTEHLASAELVEPRGDDRVGFGSIVTVEDAEGEQTTYRIVGAIEAAPRDGAIFWQSPMARALTGAQVGDTIVLPRGGEVEIVAIGS